MPNNIGVNNAGINGESEEVTIGSVNNGTINAFTINDGTLNGPEYLVTGEGLLVSFEQTTHIIGEGLLISIEQTQELRLSTSRAAIIQFEQTIQTSASSQAIITIEQTVETPGLNNFFTRNDWYPIITVDGWRIPDRQLTGMLDYTHNENNSALLDFAIIPPLGIQDLFIYQGKTVTCDVRTATGIQRVFTGKIDIPEADIMNERIVFRCSDNREERLANGGAGSSQLYGTYSTTVSGIITDTKQEMNARLSTLAGSLDWDGYGTPRFTSWTPKATPDFTFGDGTVYRTEPSIRIESRAQITNKVNITFNYAYQRWHNRVNNYVWTGTTLYGILAQGHTYPTRAMVAGAAGSAGKLIGNIAFGPLPPAGFYRINGALVAWQTTSYSGVSIPKTDALGSNVVDSDGNQVYEGKTTSFTDLNSIYCNSAIWQAGRRWVQTINEQYTISISAPQSIARYGVVAESIAATLTDADLTTSWENSTPTGGNTYTDQITSISEFNNATVVLLQQAKVKILQAHRDSRVTFDLFINPYIDLHHTIELTAGRIQCKGKVSQIIHKMNIETGEAFTTVEIALYRATGSQVESSIAPPTRPTDTYVSGGGNVQLNSYFGLDPDTYTGYDNLVGYFGNKSIVVHSGEYIDYTKTTFPTKFVVKEPDVEDEARQTRILAASQAYNIEIPTNNLVWTTVGH